MNALDQLTIDAFQEALKTLEEPLPDPLQQRINMLQHDWAAHVHELDALAEQFEPLNHCYQTARDVLQSRSASRKQLLDSAALSSSPTAAETTLPPETPGSAPSQQPTIYRYTLPSTATPQQVVAFQQQVEAIRQANPDWVVTFDRPQPGEADAIVMIYNDENYPTVHAAYIANRTLNQVVAPALTRIFSPVNHDR